MKALFIFTSLLAVLSFKVSAQILNTDTKNLNTGFEQTDAKTGLPLKWRAFASNFKFGSDSLIKHSGNRSVFLEYDESKPAGYRGAAMGLYLPINYIGKKIQLKGYLKTKDVKDGFAGLYLIMNGESKVLVFDNMQKTHLQGTNDWAEYSVELPILEEAKNVYVAALLSGKGKLWIDDLKILIDGKDISEASLRPLSAIEKDKEFDLSSDLKLASLTPSQSDNLQLLGKVWGFLKYHHPAVTEGKYNWDYELFRITPKILAAKTKEERNQVLYSWIKGMGEFTTVSRPGKKNKLLKISPDFKWIAKAELGDELTAALNRVKEAKRPANGFYAKLYDEDTPVPYFRNETGYKAFKYPDDGYRLLAVYRFWNMIEYFYPYKYGIKKDWDEVLTAYISKILKADSELNYKLTLAELVAEIQDSHTSVSGDAVISKFYGLRKPAIELKFADQTPVVLANYDKNAGTQKTGTPDQKILQTGDIITQVNGVPAALLMKKLLPYTSASNYSTQLGILAGTLLRTNDSTINLTYSRDGKPDSLRLKTYPAYQTFYANPASADTSFKIVQPGIAYIHPGKFRVKYLPAVMKSVMDCKALIIDMRTYPGETSFTNSIGDYLYEKQTDYIRFTKGSVLHPGEFEYMPDSYMKNVAIGGRRKDTFKGKLLVLIDENTQSFAEMSAMAFRARPNTLLIGSQTAGADGNVMPNVLLPGSMNFTFTGIGVYYLDGRETQRIGIVPDIEVKPTVKGIRDGKDEVLEKAIAEAQK